MTKRIELTELELRMLKANINGEFFPPEATMEECVAMRSVISKADDLMEELDAYDELDSNLMLWFLNKYNEQEKEDN